MIIAIARDGSVHKFRLHDRKPNINSKIINLTISGEELEEVKSKFANLIYVHGETTMVYKGEIATLLWDNF